MPNYNTIKPHYYTVVVYLLKQNITGWLTIEKTGSGFEGLVNFYTFGASYVNVALSISLAP